VTLDPAAKQSPFDREKSSLHYLTVEARDDLGRGNRNTVEIVVHVIDVNDNPPRWTFLKDRMDTYWIFKDIFSQKKLEIKKVILNKK
jgi:hypothetical protein